MTVTITKKDETVTVELKNDSNGNDLQLTFTPDDARQLAEKILEVLALS